MSLFTDSDDFKTRRAELEDAAMEDLVRTLSYMFGSVGVRGLKTSDLEWLREILRNHAGSVSSRVEGFYVRESAKQSEEGALNTLRAIIAGGAATRRDLTGEEPSEWEKTFVEGTSELVDLKGANAYIKTLGTCGCFDDPEYDGAAHKSGCLIEASP